MKNTKLIYTDAKSSTMVIYDQKFEDGYCFLSGTAISSQHISEIEVKPFKFNPPTDMDVLKHDIKWSEFKETPTLTLSQFNILEKEYNARITASKNGDTHHVEITKPSGAIQTLITYDNIAEAVILGIVAGSLCLGSLGISALLLDRHCPEGLCFKLVSEFELLPPKCRVVSECKPCK